MLYPLDKCTCKEIMNEVTYIFYQRNILCLCFLFISNELLSQISDMAYFQGGTVTVGTVLRNPDMFQGMVLLGPALKPNPETASPIKVNINKKSIVITLSLIV